jgi:uncharacterized RDD family membrane protein YckC
MQEHTSSPALSAEDRYTIQSSTGVEVSVRLAGAGARSNAFIIDWHIRTLVAVAWLLLSSYATYGSFLPQTIGPTGLHFALTVAAPAAIYLLYHPVLELLMRGRTPGKRMGGVRLINRNGTIPGAGALLTRNMFRIIDSFPFFYGVGLVSVMMTREHLRIGDLAAGTLLVYDDAPALKELA